MQFSEISPVVFCVVPPFALGWLLFSLAVGIRGDWEAGLRLFLLGFAFLGAFSAIVLSLFYLPDWAAVFLLSVTAIWLWSSMIRYFVAAKFSGKVVTELPRKREKWSISLWWGAIIVLLGLQTLLLPNIHISLDKSYALGLWFISSGVLRVLEGIRYTQFREKGILYETGSFYRWDNIEEYGWKFGEDKLSLRLRRSIFKKHVKLKILSQYRHEAVMLLSQHIGNTASHAEGYVPIQKAG